jgi:3-isopropylmalate/(R)-2-methylmalate dehydratase small subunit
MENIDPDFVKNVRKGDIIVVGEDFGCGSSREHAVWALRGAGVRAVIADTFARIFYRNCINNGFLAVECRNVSEKIQTGDELEINVKGGEIRNLTQNEEYTFLPIPEFAQEIIDAGGLLNYIARKVN